MAPIMIGAAFHDRRVRRIAVALVVLKLWFISAQPMVVIAGAGHDDRLFVELASRILEGAWLGAYDQLTLAKGAGYPLFIAATVWLGVPLPLAEHLLYLFACWMLTRAMRPLFSNDVWALVLFAGLAWQPFSYALPGPWTGSVMRQNIHTPFALLIFAALIALHTRRRERPLARGGWAVLGGCAAGWFWITREESVWIVPSVVLLTIVGLAIAWRDPERKWRTWIWPHATALGFALLLLALVSARNFSHYGWFGTTEFRADAFISAYSALTRVRVDAPMPRVPVTNEARRAIYAASPTFARLKPALEGGAGRRWRGGADAEFNGGMWVWALRDAVMETFHPASAREALAYYQQLANEVNAACDEGRLPATGKRHSLMPPWQPAYTRGVVEAWLPYATHFLAFRGFSARPAESQVHGIPDLLLIFRDLGQWPISQVAGEPRPELPHSRRAKSWRVAALDDIGHVVRWIVIASLVVGALAWVASLAESVRRRSAPGYLWWVASAALGGAAAVFTVSLLIHVTSWHDLRPVRLLSGYPLLVLFACGAGADALGHRWSWRRRSVRQ